MLLKNLSFQWPSLNDSAGEPIQYSRWYPPVKQTGDPTSGLRMYAQGDDVSFWTPPSFPDGLVRAVRFTPAPGMKSLKGAAGRPRAQAELGKTLHVDPEAIAQGWPDELADGYVGMERWFKDYFLLDPDFHIPSVNPFDRPPTTVMDWHGDSSYENAQPNIDVQIKPHPTNDSPLHLCVIIRGGRYQPHNSGPPPYPWDKEVTGNVGAALQYSEIVREYDLLGGNPIELGKWYKIVFHNIYHWDITQALTEIWVEGIKRVGLGVTPLSYSTTQSRNHGDADPWPVNQERLPNIWYPTAGVDVGRPVQQGRWASAMYEPQEARDAAIVNGWYDEALWDRYMWTRTIWHTGTGFYSEEADVEPTVAAQVKPPQPVETWDVLPTPGPRVLSAGEADEGWVVAGPGKPHVRFYTDPAGPPAVVVERDSDGGEHVLT